MVLLLFRVSIAIDERAARHQVHKSRREEGREIICYVKLQMVRADEYRIIREALILCSRTLTMFSAEGCQKVDENKRCMGTLSPIFWTKKSTFSLKLVQVEG
jgi:hypothetical protein